MSKIDTNDYQDFVKTTISKPSSDISTFLNTVDSLYVDSLPLQVKLPELLTACFGLTAESGEFVEVVKKIVFQGKPLDADNIYHLKRELGDVMWYVAVACTALNTSLEEILVMNVEKLSARYPAGFEIIKSEVRKDGDI